jgi:peptide chain release factor 3
MEKASSMPIQTTHSSRAPAVSARRTFAIISHPDAGKTTLTEKLLLYGNAINLAGNVRARRNQRSTTSDWMAMERERGISISSTVLQFPCQGYVINLLDTPGHEDFSEDTYRTLAAVDSAVMVLDAAKGIEPQTRKLFAVCRQRGLPVFTFINKMDRPARDPLALLDEIETILGMQPVPINWPLGDGPNFCGVYDRIAKGVCLYERTLRNERMAPEEFVTLETLQARGILAETSFQRLHDDLDLLDGLGLQLEPDRVAAAEQTPVFFGSALTNFGVRQFLEAFLAYAPAPQAYPSNAGPIPPERSAFSGFVFKIQANMNPRHRDCVAFVRVCSGRFERETAAIHAQTGKTVRLQAPYRFFANEREVIDTAYPGDVVGLFNNGDFSIGDTLCAGEVFHFLPMPRFQPEHFAVLRNADPGKQKQFIKGLRQLEVEGSSQILYNQNALRREPILAVVGQLQFEVVQARLQAEYNVSTILERLPHKLARWVTGPEKAVKPEPLRTEILLARDSEGRLVALFSSAVYLGYFLDKYPKLGLELISEDDRPAPRHGEG